MRATEIKASDVKPGDVVLDHEENEVAVIASFRDGHGATASWHIEGIVEGLPTRRMRGAPDMAVDLVERAA